VHDPLLQVVSEPDFVFAPQLIELWAAAVKCVEKTSGFFVVGGPAERCAKVRCVASGVNLVVVGQESEPLFGHEEPSVDLAAGESGVGGLDAEQRLGERVLFERDSKVRNDLSGRVETIQDAQQRGAYVICASTTRPRLMASEP
jgi:hypothetical protein